MKSKPVIEYAATFEEKGGLAYSVTEERKKMIKRAKIRDMAETPKQKKEKQRKRIRRLLAK